MLIFTLAFNVLINFSLPLIYSQHSNESSTLINLTFDVYRDIKELHKTELLYVEVGSNNT